MSKISKNKYLEEFKEYTTQINSSKKSATEFYVKAGINTPKGNLSKVYYHTPIKIGYKK